MSRDDKYKSAIAEFGDAIGRLAYAYERDSEKRKDLLQDIHFELWRSFKIFDGRSSVRTWVYRVAHNIAASHVLKNRKISQHSFFDVDDIEDIPDHLNATEVFEKIDQIHVLMGLIEWLNPADRQIITLYLEDMNAASIGEIIGSTPSAVATKIHRIKLKLSDLYQKGDINARKRSKLKNIVAKPTL